MTQPYLVHFSNNSFSVGGDARAHMLPRSCSPHNVLHSPSYKELGTIEKESKQEEIQTDHNTEGYKYSVMTYGS